MLVVLVGLPGSGKTRYAEANFRTIIAPDRIRLEEFGVRFDRRYEPLVWRRAYARVREGLAAGGVVCFDATSVTRQRRRPLLRLAAEAGVPAIAVWFRTPPELAWRRNRDRPDAVPRSAFRGMAEAFQPPAVDEGFAAVLEMPCPDSGT